MASSDTEVERIFECVNETRPCPPAGCMGGRSPSSSGGQSPPPRRPPSSYGSMRSEEEEEELMEADSSAILPQTEGITGIQLLRNVSPETVLTQTTHHTKGPGAIFIDTRSDFDLDDVEEEEEEEEEGDEEDEEIMADSPEPPPPGEPEEEEVEDDDAQPGHSHIEQDLPYIFKNIQHALSGLTPEELMNFKRNICRDERTFKELYQQLYECDILDLVDKMIEVEGVNHAVSTVVRQLANMKKLAESKELEKRCKRVMLQFRIKVTLIRKHAVLFEGVVQSGRQKKLRHIYVEPEISRCGLGGIDPWHEIRQFLPPPPPLPGSDTFVKVNNLFRLRKDSGDFVRTLLTTALPGYGLSVLVAKFSLDWAEERANKDLQFVIQMSFRNMQVLVKHHLPASKKMSLMDMLAHSDHGCENNPFLEEPDARFLIIMDCYECFTENLDWKNCPEVTDARVEAHPTVLVVNLMRGHLLPAARVWLLGRRASVSNIPAELFDVITEIQGYNEDMKDVFLSQRFRGEDQSMGPKVVAHTKQLPSLRMLCRSPFLCWITATLLHQCFLSGDPPPKLTSFYMHVMVIQTNRKLDHYYDHKEPWSDHDRQMLLMMGKMALKLLEKSRSVFYDEDLKEHGLVLKEVVVWSGLCTLIPEEDSSKRKKYAFIHLTFQEFLAAMYVFTMVSQEGRNVLVGRHQSLVTPRFFTSREAPRCALDVCRSAINRTLNSLPRHYDMFLRFLCGILNNVKPLRGYLFEHRAPKVNGQEEVAKLLEKRIESAPVERKASLKECLRELTQADD